MSLADNLSAYFSARSELSALLDVSVYDLDDLRQEDWNGDTSRPGWGTYDPEYDEWMYSEEGLHYVQKEGLTFIYMHLSTGGKCWGVFDDAKIKHHEAAEEEL